MGRLDISDNVKELAGRAVRDAEWRFRAIDEIAQLNTEKVLSAFQRHRVSDSLFSGTTGYGYDDKGRDTLDRVFADVMGMPSALVRAGFVGGTHAITAALFAALRPGQTLLSATGLPYDTLHGAIGIAGEHPGSLKDYRIGYKQVELLSDGSPDHEAIKAAASRKKTGAVFVQRSRGYSSRRALTVREIGEISKTVHKVDAGITVIVDNSYGEFTEKYEPGDLGADLIAGSLIKNPGGGSPRRAGTSRAGKRLSKRLRPG